MVGISDTEQFSQNVLVQFFNSKLYKLYSSYIYIVSSTNVKKINNSSDKMYKHHWPLLISYNNIIYSIIGTDYRYGYFNRGITVHSQCYTDTVV